MREKEIHYYDSTNKLGTQYMNAIKQWLVDEALEKKNMDLNLKGDTYKNVYIYIFI
jgi:hypothetical protein